MIILVLLLATTVRSQKSSFNVAGIRPYDKAVPGQVMDVLIEGLTSGAAPTVLPESDFTVDVSQDGVTQAAKVRITKFTMVSDFDPRKTNGVVDIASMKMRPYHAVGFVVPKVDI